MSKDQTNENIARWKITAGVAIALLIVGILYYSLESGLMVSKVSVPGMVEFEFAERKGLGSMTKPEQASEPALRTNQAQLEQKLAELEQRLAEHDTGSGAPLDGGTIDLPPPASVPALYGQWASPQGLSYVIQQQGTYLTIQELNPWLGVTAVGEGTISGNLVNISYSTAAGTIGQARLQISPDARQMWGESHDLTTGIVVSMQMRR